jgi:hypothetical protein
VYAYGMDSFSSYRMKPRHVRAMRWDGTAEGAGPIINALLEYPYTTAVWVPEHDGYGLMPPNWEPYIRVQIRNESVKIFYGWWVVLEGETYRLMADHNFTADFEEE